MSDYKNMKIIMPRIYIRWIDSNAMSDGGWHQASQIEDLEPTTVETVGFLYKEGKDFYTTVSSIAVEGCITGIMSIPKCAVLEVMIYPDENDLIRPKEGKKNVKNES